MKKYLKTWNLNRIIRLVIGFFFFFEGLMSQQWGLMLMGGLFTLMPLLNIGCCGVSGCNTTLQQTDKKMEEVKYEEIK